MSISKEYSKYHALYDYIVKELSKYVYGQPLLVKTLATVGAASLCGIPYHVLIIGPPGTGKTWSVRCLCEITGLPYARVQGNPDILPSDVLGDVYPYYDSSDGKVKIEVLLGPIFEANGIGAGDNNPLAISKDVCGILFVDEINRMHPRTLNFLVEVMAEQRVTIKGCPKSIPVKVSIVATANTLEEEGIFTIPTHIIDRFNAIVEIDYPDEESEKLIVSSAFKRMFNVDPNPITVSYIVKLIRLMRTAKMFTVSTRIAISLLEWIFLNYGSTDPRYLTLMNDEEYISIIRRSITLNSDEISFLRKLVRSFKENMSKELRDIEAERIKILEEDLRNIYSSIITEETRELNVNITAHKCEGMDCSQCGKCWKSPIK